MENIALGIGKKYHDFDILKSETSKHMPKETNTYQPIAFHELVEIVKNSANEIFNVSGMVSVDNVKEDYLVSKNDQQFFGTLTYSYPDDCYSGEVYSGEGDNNDTKLTIGIRSSYDKSIANGIAIGGQVIVCSNLMFVGDITYMRKHTKNSINDIVDQINGAINEQVKYYTKLQDDKEYLKDVFISHEVGNYLLGNLFGNRLINSGQLLTASTCWNKKWYHQDFMQEYYRPRNKIKTHVYNKTAWVLYNCITEGLKKNTPMNMMTSHKKVHNAYIYNLNKLNDQWRELALNTNFKNEWKKIHNDTKGRAIT